MKTRAVFFDLDNTLYDYRDYYSYALLEIGKYLADKYEVDVFEVHKWGIEILSKKSSRYPKLFDDLLDMLDIPRSEVKKCVEIFNTISPPIGPFSDVIPTLEKLKDYGVILGIITDGNPLRQSRKIKLLGLSKYFNIVVFSYEYGYPKPAKEPYIYALRIAKVTPAQAYYVGDDPRFDFKGAKEIGMTTIRLLRGEFVNIPRNEYIDYEIESLPEIIEIILG